MAKSDSQQVLPATSEVVRDGPVRLRITQESPTSAFLEVGVDYEKATPPERAYAADFCEAAKMDIDFVLIFGKLIPGKNRLRNKVEISFSRSAFGYQLWRNSRDLHASLAQSVGADVLLNFTYEDTEVVQSFRANNAFMVWMGDEALIDFYYIAPSELHYARSGKRSRIPLDPVLRVVLSTPVLLHFLDKIDQLVQADAGLLVMIESMDQKVASSS